MAFLTEKTLFIHVQKTGGMSVRQVLYQCTPLGRESGDSEDERHFGLPELRASHPGIEAGRLSFGFVRHPVAWLRSRWAFAVMTGFVTHTKHGRSAAATWMACCWSDNFETFIERYLERYPGVATQTMFRMLGLWSDKPADMIGKTETLMEDLRRILEAAGEIVPPTAFTRSRTNETMKAIAQRATLSPILHQGILDVEELLCRRFNYD
jgi:hypothetical protein